MKVLIDTTTLDAWATQAEVLARQAQALVIETRRIRTALVDEKLQMEPAPVRRRDEATREGYCEQCHFDEFDS